MEMNDQAYNALQQYLQQTLNPTTQKNAERQLAEVEVQQGFPILLLKLINDNNVEMVLRFAGSLYFKNYIKRHWVPDNEQANKIAIQDRVAIKTDIVQILISVPDKIQLQISDALSIMAASDFPEQWQDLLPQLISRLSPTDYRVNNGILQIAHSIFKRWRSQFESNSLFSDIKYVLELFCEPYQQLLQITDKLMRENENNRAALGPLSQSLILLIKIFYDLNCQDLPEFFEDNMPQFMEFFKYYLVYHNQLLDTGDEEEAGALEKIKTSICEVLELYTQKYEEDFPQLVDFFSIVVDLLANLGPEPKHDTLVCKGLALLTSMVKNERTAGVLGSGDTFKQMCERIALKNIPMREVDEELFEDNPIEYIRRDLEGSDTDTRRRAAADFIRGLMERYERDTTAIMSQYIGYYLQEYNANPQGNWKSKNTAIFLLVAIASRTSTMQLGVTQTNQLVDVVDFFTKNILSDLQTDVNAGVPILKVDAIKYLYTFRSQLTKDQLLTVFPLLVKHLESNNYVVYTYSAIAIERILFMRKEKVMIFSAADIAPYAENLLSQLFRLIEQGETPQKLSENDYLMRAVMRVIITCRQDMVPYVNVIMGKLTSILGIISANPSNPRFNHYIFESIGALIRFICPISDGAVTEFENMLFGPFQTILDQDVQEFTPYVFQLLAQLLEHHKKQDLTEAYVSLLNPLLNPPLWEQGNIPALVRLLEAYLNKGINTIVSSNKLEPILGIFQQKLINSRQNDQYALTLLNAVIKTVPFELLAQYLPALVTAVLTRLQTKKKGERIIYDKFTRNFTLWICKSCSIFKWRSSKWIKRQSGDSLGIAAQDFLSSTIDTASTEQQQHQHQRFRWSTLSFGKSPSLHQQPFNNYAVTDAIPNTELLSKLKQDPSNGYCADCGDPNPEWCSLNLGILLCIECSGIHRSLGTHISKVRSLTLDSASYTPDIVSLLRALGNGRSNAIWESSLSATTSTTTTTTDSSSLEGNTTTGATSPKPDDTRNTKLKYIQAKYVERAFVQNTTDDPQALLFDAIDKDDIPAAMHAIALGADINACRKDEKNVIRIPMGTSDDDNDDEQHHWEKSLSLETAEYIVRYPIHFALLHGRVALDHDDREHLFPMAEMLLQNGADTGIVDPPTGYSISELVGIGDLIEDEAITYLNTKNAARGQSPISRSSMPPPPRRRHESNDADKLIV